MSRRDAKAEWSLAVLALIAACHGSEGTEAAPSADAGSADATEMTDALLAAGDGKAGARDAADPRDGAAACSTEIGSCPWDRYNWWKVLIDAQDFGDGAHFVAMGGQATLVALADGSYRVALLDYPRPADNGSVGAAVDDEYDSWALPPGPLQPIAVAERYFMGAGTRRSLFVLACDHERAHCRLSRADLDEGSLSAWQQSELPAEFRGRNLIFDFGSDLQIELYAICAYGSGLVCLREGESWRTEIPASTDLSLNDIEISDPWSLAVGERGRWFKRERVELELGPWEEQPSLGQVALTQVAVASAGAVVLGDGRIQARLGDKQMLYSCGLPDELLALFVNIGEFPNAVTPSGEVLWIDFVRNKPQGYCLAGQLAVTPLLEVGTVTCGGSTNPRILTEHALLGTNACVVL